MHLAAILPLAGYELCRRGVTLGDTFGSPRVWFGVVAPSSVGKTSTLGAVRKFSEAFYKDRFRDGAQPKPWVSLEGSLPGVIHAISTLTDERGRTAGILYHNEFSKVVRLDDVVEPLNEIYDGRDYTRNLRYLQKAAEIGQSNSQAQIKNPAFSAVVTTTPRAFERVIKPEILEGGLFVRFLWLHEQISPGDLQPRRLKDDLGLARVLWTWDNWFGLLEAARLRGMRPIVEFAPEATYWLDNVFFELLRGRIAKEDVEAGLALRAPEHAQHIAAIYAASRGSFLVDDPNDAQAPPYVYVTVNDVIRAANLVTRCFYRGTALGVQLGLPHMQQSEKVARAIEAVKAAGLLGCTRSQIHRVFSGNLGRGEIDELVATLVDLGAAVEETASTGRPGRPRKTVFSMEAWFILEAKKNKPN